MKRRTTFAAVTVALVLGLGAAAVYLVVRARGAARGTRAASSVRVGDFKSIYVFDQDPELGSVVKKNLRRARLVVPGRPHPLPTTLKEMEATIKKRRVFFVTTNSMGWRNQEVKPEPARGTVRIINLGDSVTFGWGVADDRTYSAVLGKLLRKRGAFEVINIGIPSLDSTGADRLLARVERFQPRLVTINVGLNDLAPDLTRSRSFDPAFGQPARRYRQVVTRLAKTLRGMLRRLQDAGIKAVLFVPPMNSFYPRQDGEYLCQAIRGVARDQHLPLIDLPAIFSQEERKSGLVVETRGGTQRLLQYSGGRSEVLVSAAVEVKRRYYISRAIYDFLENRSVSQRLSIDGCHPNEAGHELAARLLLSEVLKLVQRQGPPR